MKNNYKGKHPERIKHVYSLKDRRGVVGVTLNNGDRYTIAARDNDPATMPEPGREISDYRAVKVGPVFKFGYWSTHDADGSRLYHEEKPEWWDRGFRKDEPNADGIGWCAKYPESEPGTDPESADNYGPVAGTQEEALRAMEAAWLEWRADYVKEAEKERATGVIRAEELTGGNRLLEEAGQALKDILGAAENGQPYSQAELERFVPALVAEIEAACGDPHAIAAVEATRKKTGFKRAEPESAFKVFHSDSDPDGEEGRDPRGGWFYQMRDADTASGPFDTETEATKEAWMDAPFMDYCEEADRLASKLYGIEADDMGLDFDNLAEFQEAGDTPREAVEYRGEKLGLTRIPAQREAAAKGPLGAGTFKSAMQKNAPEVAQLVRADLIEAGQWLVGSSPGRNQFVQEVAHFTGGRVVLRTNYTGRTDEEPGGSSIMNGADRLYVADSREAVRPKGPAQTTGAKL